VTTDTRGRGERGEGREERGERREERGEILTPAAPVGELLSPPFAATVAGGRVVGLNHVQSENPSRLLRENWITLIAHGCQLLWCAARCQATSEPKSRDPFRRW